MRGQVWHAEGDVGRCGRRGVLREASIPAVIAGLCAWPKSGRGRRQRASGVQPCCCCADSDGFFHTGDVGELTAAGTLKVVDRIKNMFKLAQGEYIAAEHLENKYT